MSSCAALFFVLSAVQVAASGAGWPCIGRPAVTLPGGTFALGDASQGTVELVSDSERITVQVTSPDGALPYGSGLAVVPPHTPPGRYHLAIPGATGDIERPGAVYVLAEAPVNYTVALVRSDNGGSGDRPLFSSELIASITASASDLVIVIGALTADGQEASYRALAAQFGGLAVPVVFCPDRAELGRGAYSQVFGDPVYGFRYGNDGYLLLGAGPDHADSGAEARLGPIHRWRRELRACRWSTGVAGRFGLDWSIRSQLILFVDDPLDYLIAGALPPGFGDRLPWGRTRLAVAPTGPAAPLQLISVTESGLAPQPADSPAE